MLPSTGPASPDHPLSPHSTPGRETRPASPNSRTPKGSYAPAAKPDRRQRVRVPWALVESAFYADVALAVYMKVKALGQRPEGCTAGAATLASYLKMSTSSVERGLAQLRSPRPEDGVVELPENTRRSLPGGTGTTARRRVRAMSATERYVWLPVAACEDLTSRQLRAYAVLMFTQVQRIPLTLGELAGLLRHHSGQRAGQPITATAAAAVVDELEASGWATVQRRAGGQGRNHYLAHEIPRTTTAYGPGTTAGPIDAPADETTRTTESVAESATGERPSASSSGLPAAVVGEGSGAPVRGGSLVNREDQRTARPDDEPRLSSPAVGETRVVTSAAAARNRLEARAVNPAPGLALRADGENSPPPAQRPRTGASGGAARPCTGPQLTLSPQIYAVLEPVHWLLHRVDNPFLVRQIAREVGRQLRDGTDAARLSHRLTVRFAGTSVAEIRDPGRWLLGVALPRWGCGHLDCEAGTMWSTGAACAVCAEVVADRRAARQRASRPLDPSATAAVAEADHSPVVPAVATSGPPGPPRATCGECGCRIFLIGPSLTDGLCKPCRTHHSQVEGEVQETGAGPSVKCAGWNGLPCDRPALPTRTVCARHRAREMAGEREAS
ncbi:hypothetical protein AB0451_31965 [Streptomyces sp. NPDC052000]|uniref:hypothetical protein n=1 Tax=Streptomyces sp. NPDC052000 TaxID=3155676 RepID=UPI00344DB71A